MSYLNIQAHCKTSLVSRDDGAQLRATIEKHWGDNEQLVLDFSGVIIASISFFDESLGRLASLHPLKELTKRVQVINISNADRTLLNKIVLARSKEYNTTFTRGSS